MLKHGGKGRRRREAAARVVVAIEDAIRRRERGEQAAARVLVDERAARRVTFTKPICPHGHAFAGSVCTFRLLGGGVCGWKTTALRRREALEHLTASADEAGGRRAWCRCALHEREANLRVELGCDEREARRLAVLATIEPSADERAWMADVYGEAEAARLLFEAEPETEH